MSGEYWKDYMCNGCGKPFTLKEWEDRATPHDADCPNSDDDVEEFIDCTCDNNYHEGCYHAN